MTVFFISHTMKKKQLTIHKERMIDAIDQLYYTFTTTTFGKTFIASTQQGICYLAFVSSLEEGLNDVSTRFDINQMNEKPSTFFKDILLCLEGDYSSITNIKLHLKGTDFQWKVWEELLKISFGKTVSYQDIAIAIENPKAVRAVGTAIGKNPISFLIPCHRVIQSSGGLGGYAWGLECKKQLLAWEAVNK